MSNAQENELRSKPHGSSIEFKSGRPSQLVRVGGRFPNTKRLTMNRVLSHLALFVGVAVAMTVVGQRTYGQDKKSPQVIEGTAKAGKWGQFQQTYTGKLHGGKVALKWMGTNVKGENKGSTATLSPK